MSVALCSVEINDLEEEIFVEGSLKLFPHTLRKLGIFSFTKRIVNN